MSNTASSVCWTADGLRFALGHENGLILLKDKDNEKEYKSLNLNQTILCMSFSSVKLYTYSRYLKKEFIYYR